MIVIRKRIRNLVGASAILVGAVVWLAIRYWPDSTPPTTFPEHGEVWFEDAAASAGIDFHHFDPATPQHLLPETMGSGIAWIDYDSDGWPDLFCLQDGPQPPSPPLTSLTHRLYRNNRNGTFTNVSAETGLNLTAFGVGCAVGDYDNDGFDDLFITNLSSVTLLHNETDSRAPGGRRFRDVTHEAGLANRHWGTSCAWGDLDGDGRLDLYVCNYVVIDPEHPQTCRQDERGPQVACSPAVFPLVNHVLYRNLGGGRFEDVSQSSGITRARPAPGLGVVIADLDEDGRPDIYVANDMSESHLFHNLGGMKFEERATRSGAGLGPGGSRIAGMGIALGDFDGSFRPSIVVTNYQDGPNVLFLNRGKMLFDDLSMRSGLGGPSLSKLGFGICPIDADLDGKLDLAITNGHVTRSSYEMSGAPYAQECQLFMGDGYGQFRNVSAEAGPDFRRARVGRGLASCDYDGDGLIDLACSAVGERLALFRNRTKTNHNWISLELIANGSTSNRNAIGATIDVVAEGKTRRHFVFGGGSYLSASDRRLHLGLGDARMVDRVVVRWPSGTRQEFRELPSRSRWKLIEGQPAAQAVPAE